GSLDWVPRSVRQKASLIERTAHTLEGVLGRPPSEEEIARELGLSLESYQELLARIGEMSLFSLEDLGFGRGEERLNLERRLERDEEDPLGALLTQERVDLVAEAIARLPEREKLVITLYYHEELTMKEVGSVRWLRRRGGSRPPARRPRRATSGRTPPRRGSCATSSAASRASLAGHDRAEAGQRRAQDPERPCRYTGGEPAGRRPGLER